MGLGTAEVPPRPHIFANKFETWLGVMPAYLADSEAMGVKIVGDNPHNFKKGKPNNPALMLLNNPQTGEPLMVMDGIGIFAGFTATLIIQQLPGLELLGYAAAIGLSSIFMDITETEHPPAAGTALGIALTGFSLEAAVTVIGGAIGLSFSHRILRRWLKDIIR